MRGGRRGWAVPAAALVVVAAGAATVALLAGRDSPHGITHGTLAVKAPATAVPGTGRPRALHLFHDISAVRPVLLGAQLVSAHSAIVAHRVTDGRATWSYRRANQHVLDQAVGDDALYALWDDGVVTALRADGRTRWESRPATAATPTGVTWTGRYLLVDTSAEVQRTLTRLDPATGRSRTIDLRLPKGCGLLKAQMTVPAVQISTVTCTVDSYAVSLTDGALLWDSGPFLRPVPLDAEHVAIRHGAYGEFAVYDVHTGTSRVGRGPSSTPDIAAGCGTRVLLTGGEDTGPPATLALASVGGRAPIWQQRTPVSGVFESVVCRGDRIYDVRARLISRNTYRRILEIRALPTGDLLGRASLPDVTRAPDEYDGGCVVRVVAASAGSTAVQVDYLDSGFAQFTAASVVVAAGAL